MRTTKTSSRSNTKSISRSHRTIPGARALKNLKGIKDLKAISNRQLLSSIRKLSEKERETVLSILVHLAEIDRRKLYLPMGYSTLYEFCKKHLGYCEATAGRRVNVARCIGRFPLAYRALASGKVSLTNLTLITKLMTTENAGELLSRIAGAPKKEIELLLSSRNPRSAVRDSVRTVHVRTVIEVPVPEVPAQDVSASGDGKEFTITGDGKNSATSKGVTSMGSGPAAATESGCWPALTERSAETERPVLTERRIVLEERFEVKFGADQEFIEKIERLRSLLSSKHHRRLEFEELFSIVMDEYIERHSPEGRTARKEKREQKKATRPSSGASKKLESTPGAASTDAKKQDPVSRQKPEQSRYIPRKVRDEVYARDHGRCSYVSPGGRTCHSTWDLQIDHIVPFARGGDNSPDNLRLLCAKHNRLEAERVYGEKHMERYVKESGEYYVMEHAGQYCMKKQPERRTERYVKEHGELYNLIKARPKSLETLRPVFH